MRIDAYDDWCRREAEQQWVGVENQVTGYIPGYDPDNDPWYNVAGKPHYSEDLFVASENYWAGRTGSTTPPAPSYRDGKLGRLVDVYGCQAMMREARHNWQVRWWGAIITFGCLLAFGVELGVLDVAALPIFAGIWLTWKHHYARQYRKYYNAQAEILATGKPVWVSYERKRLRLIERNAFYSWP